MKPATLFLDDLSLVYVEPDVQPAGIIQFVVGIWEHKERYLPLMEFLSTHGFATLCHDLRGHGATAKSPAELGYIGKGGWKTLVEDVRKVAQWARKQWPSRPLNLFSHSMGSLIARSFLKRHDDEVDRVILSGSPSYNPATPAGLALTGVISLLGGRKCRSKAIQGLAFDSFNKKYKQEGYPRAWICSDKAVQKAYHEDPLCQFTLTVDAVRNMLFLVRDTYSPRGWQMAHPDLPVLFLAGEEDPCLVSPQAFHKAVAAMRDHGYRNVSVRTYPGMRHEVHNETGKEKVWNDILAFFSTGSLSE